MRTKIIAGDSLGTRSMATYIETRDIKIFIDPGVALAPLRYGLPPHPIERELMENTWHDIVRYAEKSDVIIITHYHYDHYNPKKNLEEIYRNKNIFIKDYRKNINPSQIRRSRYFLNQLESLGLNRNIHIADSTTFTYGDTELIFSPPYPHGIDNTLGYVIMVYVNDGVSSFLYSSDVEGPYDMNVVNFILSMDPEVILLDGPPTYLKNSFSNEYFESSIANINTIILYLDSLKTLIIDHHFMRDKEYKNWVTKIWRDLTDNSYINVISIAEYMGKNLNMLEAYRDILYEKFGR